MVNVSVMGCHTLQAAGSPWERMQASTLGARAGAWPAPHDVLRRDRVGGRAAGQRAPYSFIPSFSNLGKQGGFLQEQRGSGSEEPFAELMGARETVRAPRLESWARACVLLTATGERGVCPA